MALLFGLAALLSLLLFSVVSSSLDTEVDLIAKEPKLFELHTNYFTLTESHAL